VIRCQIDPECIVPLNAVAKPKALSGKVLEAIMPAKMPGGNPVKKVRAVLQLIAPTLILNILAVQAATATSPANVIASDDNSARSSTSVARTGVVTGVSVEAHPFVDEGAIQKSQLEIFVADYSDGIVDIFTKSGKLLGQLNGLKGHTS
jgi:hypothetical protein